MSQNNNERVGSSVNGKSQAQALNGEYRDLYNRLIKQLREDVQPGEELERAISSILQMLSEAAEEKRPVLELIPDGFDVFYQELLDALPVYTRESRLLKRRRAKMRWIAVTAILVLTIVLGALWQSGYVGMWQNGIAYMAGTLDKYSYHESTLEDGFEIIIDLADLESNTGKVLYEKDDMYIDVYTVDEVGLQGGGYRIHFRSHGKYSMDKAVLVSGNKHYATESRWYSYTTNATIRSEYNGKQYEGSVMGSSGLNYKDGDMFSFYIFPSEAYNSGDVTTQENGKVKITISNLVVNQWFKK